MALCVMRDLFGQLFSVIRPRNDLLADVLSTAETATNGSYRHTCSPSFHFMNRLVMRACHH